MKRALIALAVLAGVAVLAGGWIFHTRTIPPAAEYHGTFNGNDEVGVWFENGTALDAAEKAARDYRAAGWTELPVSTATFKLFAKGTRTAAFLAEDVPAGARVTELIRKGNKWD